MSEGTIHVDISGGTATTGAVRFTRKMRSPRPVRPNRYGEVLDTVEINDSFYPLPERGALACGTRSGCEWGPLRAV